MYTIKKKEDDIPLCPRNLIHSLDLYVLPFILLEGEWLRLRGETLFLSIVKLHTEISGKDMCVLEEEIYERTHIHSHQITLWGY